MHVVLSVRVLGPVSARVATNHGVCKTKISSFLLQLLSPDLQISCFAMLLIMYIHFCDAGLNNRSDIKFI